MDWRRRLSTSFNNVGGLLQAQNKLKDASAAYEDARSVTEQLIAENPGDVEWRRDIVVSLYKLADVSQALEDTVMEDKY